MTINHEVVTTQQARRRSERGDFTVALPQRKLLWLFSKRGSRQRQRGSHRVVRGGSWNDLAAYCRLAYRYTNVPTGRTRPTFVFEAFSEQLRNVHLKNGKPNHAVAVKDYAPARLRNWLQDEAGRYFKTHPKAKRFKLHNFRGTAMSRARMAGVSYDDAAVAFGCHPETMRKHYISLDETTISDRVMEGIQSKRGEKSGEKDGTNGDNHASANPFGL